MNKPPPLVSIITINYNNAIRLDNCLNSVLNQPSDLYELIVIDGASTDNSISIINAHSRRIHYFLTEEDNGIANAFNKGIKAAKGEYILFVNSDNMLFQNSLKNFSRFIEQSLFLPDIIYGITYREALDGFVSFKSDLSSSLSFYLRMPFSHCSVFVKRALFQDLGFFSEKYRIAMDIEWFLRAFNRGYTAAFFPCPVAIQLDGGVSSSMWFKAYIEYFEVSKQYLPNFKAFSFLIARIALKLSSGLRCIVIGLFKGSFEYLLLNVIPYLPSRRARSLIYSFLSRGKISRTARIARGCKIYNPRNISIGNYSTINRGCFLDGRSGFIFIGDNVDIAPEVNLWTLEHDPNSQVHASRSGNIYIGSYSWLCNRSVVLPNSVIGRNCVLSCGTVFKGFTDDCHMILPYGRTTRLVEKLSYKLPPLPFLR